MKKNEYENKFIMSIYRIRHKSNDMVIVIPFIAALLITIIVAPILTVLEISTVIKVLAFVVPLPLVTGIMLLRKKNIIDNFVKIKEVDDLITMVELDGDNLGNMVNEKVHIFDYSEYMVKIIYNWFKALKAIGDNKITMYKISYAQSGNTFLGLKEADLILSDDNREQYEHETEMDALLEDVIEGRIVQKKIIARVLEKQKEKKV